MSRVAHDRHRLLGRRSSGEAAGEDRARARELLLAHGERRAEFAERFGCAPVASFEEALESADAVLLATPNASTPSRRRGRRGRQARLRREADRDDDRRRRADARGVRPRRRDAARRPRDASPRRRPRREARSSTTGALGTVVLAEANFSFASRGQAGHVEGAAAARRSCSSASTTRTRSSTCWARSPARPDASRARRRDLDIDDVGVAALEFESGALGMIALELRLAEDLLAAPVRHGGGARLPHGHLGLAGRRQARRADDADRRRRAGRLRRGRPAARRAAAPSPAASAARPRPRRARRRASPR